nr:immunoglobulin heavy chain junction region [Mus musculus]
CARGEVITTVVEPFDYW